MRGVLALRNIVYSYVLSKYAKTFHPERSYPFCSDLWAICGFPPLTAKCSLVLLNLKYGVGSMDTCRYDFILSNSIQTCSSESKILVSFFSFWSSVDSFPLWRCAWEMHSSEEHHLPLCPMPYTERFLCCYRIRFKYGLWEHILGPPAFVPLVPCTLVGTVSSILFFARSRKWYFLLGNTVLFIPTLKQ